MSALLAACLLAAAAAVGAEGQPATTDVTVLAGQRIAVVPEGLYGAGYDGWGDITSPQAVAHLQAVGLRYCRVEASLRELCGDRLGDYRWDYVTPRDVGVGFVDRLRRVIANGWTPIIALTTSHALPAWFQGAPTDAGGAMPWFRYRLDGSLVPDGAGDQYDELARVTRDLAAGLADRGLRGLLWETIYEIGHTMPMDDIHYHAGRGIRQGDPTAKLMGPATWPGWTVEERFVKPYLRKYGADLLDYVSVHWYATNEHSVWELPMYKARGGIVCMDDREGLGYVMETAPKYADWCRSLRRLLDDPAGNPTGKRIGVVFTEYDANATSPYGRNPEDADWPGYSAAADCYVSTNYFGGVWSASVLCGMAASGCLDIACKFNTRQYYGLVDNAPDGGFYRQPVWFAWKLLRDAGGLTPGAPMVATTVDGPKDSAAAHVGGQDAPWVEAYGVGGPDGLRVTLVNRALAAQTVRVAIRGLGPGPGERRFARYVFGQETVAPFIGRRPGGQEEGAFQGVPDDSLSARCLEPLGEVTAVARDGEWVVEGLHCRPVSLTVLAPVGR